MIKMQATVVAMWSCCSTAMPGSTLRKSLAGTQGSRRQLREASPIGRTLQTLIISD